MKRHPLLISALHTLILATGLFFPAPGSAAERAAQLLADLAAELRAMPAYTVTFAVEAQDFTAEGSYTVAERGFYLNMGEAEVYSDGTVRYETDNRRREVTIDRVNTVSRNILDDPTRAFDFLDSDYTSDLLEEGSDRVVIRLTPSRKTNASAGTITVALSRTPLRPAYLTYDFDGECITIRILDLHVSAPPKQFDRNDYTGYEYIDFR